MHKPPNDGELYAYVDANRLFLYGYGVVSVGMLFTGFYLFSAQGLLFSVFIPIFVFLGTYLVLSYLIGLSASNFSLLAHKAKVKAGKDYLPNIDVYLPTAGEDLGILDNTYRALSVLRYKRTFNVYVLDDWNRPEVRRLAERKYHFKYIARPNAPELKKAGNLRYAFTRTSGDLIVIFDADFAPRPDFLEQTVPYFIENAVSIVQTPQFFRVTDHKVWVGQGAAYIQELFYRLIQVSRNTFNGSICVGTNAVYRRKHLEKFGGTAAIGYSEDVHTGFNVHRDGKKIVYLPLNLACGVCPEEAKSFFNQQYRWCMGSFHLFLNKDFWRSKLSLMQKACYLSGMLYYIASAFSFLLLPLPSIFMLYLFPERIFWYNYIFSIPSFLFGTIILSFWTRAPFGIYAIRARFLSYWAHFFAITDKLRGDLMVWQPTNSRGQAVDRFNRFCRFSMLVNVVTVLIIFNGIAINLKTFSVYNFIPIIFFTVFNSVLQLTIYEKDFSWQNVINYLGLKKTRAPS